MQGAILQMVNHGVSTGALFLLVGVIYDRRHTRLMNEFGGLAKAMPVYAALFVIVTMASVGVPGTNGFVGEFMIIMGTIVSQVLDKQSTSQAALAAFGVILAAVYMLHVVQKMFFGPVNNPKNEHLTDINPRETLAVAPLIAMVFVIGLFPNILLSRMTDSVNAVLEDFVDGRMQYEQHAGDPSLKMRAQHGGPLEQGYPEAPSEKAVAMAGGAR
jgi:NADH-quinone oxidoreductase subunit M